LHRVPAQAPFVVLLGGFNRSSQRQLLSDAPLQPDQATSVQRQDVANRVRHQT
jgi:hypothetical protein